MKHIIKIKGEPIMSGVVGTNLVAQVGFIVKDIEAAKEKWAQFLGVEVPDSAGWRLCRNRDSLQRPAGSRSELPHGILRCRTGAPA